MFPYDIILPLIGPTGLYIFLGSLFGLYWLYGRDSAPKRGTAAAKGLKIPFIAVLIVIFGLVLPFLFTPIGKYINLGGSATIAEQGIAEIMKAINGGTKVSTDLMDLTGAIKFTVSDRLARTLIASGAVTPYQGLAKNLNGFPPVTIVNGTGTSAKDSYVSGQTFIFKITSGSATLFWPTPWTLEQVPKGASRTTHAVDLDIITINVTQFDISVYIEGTSLANYGEYNVTTQAKPYPLVILTFRELQANKGYEEYTDEERGLDMQVVATMRVNGTGSDNLAFTLVPDSMIPIKGTTDDHTWGFPVGSLYLWTDTGGAERLDSKSSVERKIRLDTSVMVADETYRFEVNLRAGTNLQYLDTHNGSHPNGSLNLKTIVFYVKK
jgi:hypothetical protein